MGTTQVQHSNVPQTREEEANYYHSQRHVQSAMGAQGKKMPKSYFDINPITSFKQDNISAIYAS